MTALMLEEFADLEREYRAFADEHVAPHAALIDREECIPTEVVEALRNAGLFATGFPSRDQDPIAANLRHGLVHEALGFASASVQGLVNVHHMAGSAIARWGSPAQKEHWVPRLASGEVKAALAITEPNVGSDAAAVETRAVVDGDAWLLRGAKCWITYGQNADLFVLLAATEQGGTAFLVPRRSANLHIEPIRGVLGCRGYMLARLHLDGVRLSSEHLLGKPGFGLTHVMATGLESGRYNLAWGCVGLARACLDASLEYAHERRQFGAPLASFQLVQQMIARMMTEVHAARLVCWHAGVLRARRDPSAIKEATMAKYYASTVVNRVAHDTLQIHGANGCGSGSPIERYVRDARIMEIIEGSTQVLELAIARYGYQERG
ncbi:MAG: acyl-CoA dehydrogenase family protein [Myxococcales bacterium]|nr:acyl-CoA dehydrogenase family protein [Myxococcales bacterium]